jgi:hypothetical protein
MAMAAKADNLEELNSITALPDLYAAFSRSSALVQSLLEFKSGRTREDRDYRKEDHNSPDRAQVRPDR